MYRFHKFVLLAALGFTVAAQIHAQQQALSWEQVRERFEQNNPTLQASKLSIDESKAQEITAFLRPNPDMTLSLDQFNPFTTHPYRPFSQLQPGLGVSYLYERLHKRDLRKESAVEATTIATSTQEDLHRTLTYTLRNAFVQTLQAKAVLALAKENLEYYDRLLEVNRVRFKAGDIAQVDLDRLELQRIQYLSDIQNATVSLRSATNAEALRDATLAGYGIARLAKFLIPDDLRAGRLVPILDSVTMDGPSVRAVYPSSRHLSPKVRSFIDELLNAWRPLAPWDQ